MGSTMSMTSTNTAYFRATSRLQRTLLTIAFLYIMLNGSPYSVLNGLGSLIVLVATTLEGFWVGITMAAIGLVVISIGVYMARRWKLARQNTNLPLLSLQTLVVTFALLVLILIAGRLINGGFFDAMTYWEIFQWSWQIPLGYFVGTGLSWAIVDRKIAGIYTTREAPPVDSDDDAVDREHGHHHHDYEPPRAA